MSFYFGNIKPTADPETDEEEDLETLLKRNHENDDNESSEDELRTLSFGSLKKADVMIKDEEGNSKLIERESKSEGDYENSDPLFFKEKASRGKKKNKHAPTEQSAKKPVSKMREIPGLHLGRSQNPNLYQDIRFDKSTGGHVDSSVIRRRYRFLDDYREREIKEMESILHDPKFLSKLPPREIESIKKRLQSVKSRLQTMKNKELEHKIIKEYQDELNKNNINKFHLKRSQRRKLVQKWRFEHMKPSQREKVMERKRKKRSGKEFKQFEWNK